MLFKANSAIFSFIMARTNQFSMRWWWGPPFTRPTCLVRICIVLANWTNSPRIDISPTWTHCPDSEPISLYSFSLILCAINTSCIVFGLTRLGFEPTFYCTRGKHCNHYTPVVVENIFGSIIYTNKFWYIPLNFRLKDNSLQTDLEYLKKT